MITTSDVLRFNPFDIEFRTLQNLEKEKKEEFFFKNFFVETKAFRDYQKDLFCAINPNSNLFKNIIILHGYSGNGKTTFLHWFKREVESKFYFDINNINEIPTSPNQNPILLSIIKKINEFTEKQNFMSLSFYERHSRISETFLKNSHIEYLRGFNKLFDEKVIAIDGNFDTNEINIKIKEHIEKFEKIFDFQAALFLYILEIIVREINSNYESFTLAFDNLDEVGFEYMTEQLWVDFKNVRSSLISFFDLKEINFDFPKKVIFLLVFREANLLVNAAHQEERIQSNRKDLKLLLSDSNGKNPSSGKKIIERRLFYLRNTRDINNDNVYKIANTIVKESYTNRVFLPLFNYDFRKLMNMVIEIAEPESTNKQENIYPKMYENIRRISPYLARGLFLHRIINYLLKYGHLRELAKKPEERVINNIGYCRPSRLLLTIIYRLSYPKGLPKNEYMMHLEKPIKFSLFDVICDYFRIIDDSTFFFNDLTLYFNIKEGSWAHLISIYNKHINSETNYKIIFKEEKEKIDKWRKNEINDTELNNFIEEKGIQLHLNASGYIYLRYIITHFEYFVVLNNYRNATNRLSLLETFYDLSYNSKLLKYDFEILLDEILQKVKRYLKNNNNFLQKTIIGEKKLTGKEYLECTNYAFIRSDENCPSFYLTRVITTHLSYIEELRRYMFFGANKRLLKIAMENNHTVKDINKKIIDIMAEYVKLLENSGFADYDMIAKATISKTGEKIKVVKNGNLNKWTPIIEVN